MALDAQAFLELSVDLSVRELDIWEAKKLGDLWLSEIKEMAGER